MDEASSDDDIEARARDWTAMKDSFNTMGYHDGLSATQDARLQEGFDDGFREGIAAGFSVSVARGAMGAAAALLERRQGGGVVDPDVLSAMITSRDRMDELAFIPQEPVRSSNGNASSASGETSVQIHCDPPAGGLGRDLKAEVGDAMSILSNVLSPEAVDKLNKCASHTSVETSPSDHTSSSSRN